MEFIKDDEELIQMYLWGFKSIWVVQKGISDNHNENYDLDDIYEYVDYYCNKSNYLKKIDNLEISPGFKKDKNILKYVLKKIVLGKSTIIEGANLVGCKRDTISNYLSQIGFVLPSHYKSKQMQLLLREYCEGRITRSEANYVLWIAPKNFTVYVKKYKAEHNIK